MQHDERFVSVLMPVRNEAPFIARTMRSVLGQDYPAHLMEILVIDGCSEDGTAEVAGTVASEPEHRGHEIVTISNPRRTVPVGLNLGLARARGDVIVRVDGHCELPTNYISRCVELLDTTGADNVGGVQRAEGDGPVGRAIACAMNSRLGSGGARYRHAREPGPAETVFLGAFRRDAFDRIGGFDEELTRTQDGELNHRLRQAGGTIWVDPSLVVRYTTRSSLHGLWRQYFQYGYYKMQMVRRRGAFAAARQVVPPALVLALAAGAAVALATRRPEPVLAVAVPYAVVVLAGSVWAGRGSPVSIPILPAAFVVMHLAWGIGFLTGLFHRPRSGGS